MHSSENDGVRSRRWFCAALTFGATGGANAWAAPPPSRRRAPSQVPAASSAAPAVPRGALGFSPAGERLAVGGYREVEIVDLNGGPGRALTAEGELVTSLAYSRDGARLAVASGLPGRSGELLVFDLSSGRPSRLSGVHSDRIQSVAFSADGNFVAACSYDRLASIWDPKSGRGRALKDHTDAVYGIAVSPDSRRIATVSGDRTLKIWDAAAGRRLYTLSDSTAELYSVAFSPDGSLVAAGGADKMLRLWKSGASDGALFDSTFAHEGPITQVVFSPDGRHVASASEDRTVKLWDARTLTEEKTFPRQNDVPLSLAMSGSGQLAVGRYDGTVGMYTIESGQYRSLLPRGQRAGSSRRQP